MWEWLYKIKFGFVSNGWAERWDVLIGMCGVVVTQQIYEHGFLCTTIPLLAKVLGMMDNLNLWQQANLLIGTDADTLAQSLDVPVRHVLKCIYVEIDVGHFL